MCPSSPCPGDGERPRCSERKGQIERELDIRKQEGRAYRCAVHYDGIPFILSQECVRLDAKLQDLVQSRDVVIWNWHMDDSTAKEAGGRKKT